jgi:methyl-accepting chemotaxis protein
LRAKAEAAEQIAKGNLTVNIPVASEVDMLGKSMVAMKERLTAILDETCRLIKAAQEGRLDVRGEDGRFEGSWATLIKELNRLIDAFVIPIRLTADYVNRISRGDIPPHISQNWQGEFNDIQRSLNHCVDVMNLVLRDAFRLFEAAKHGRQRYAQSGCGVIASAGGKLRTDFPSQPDPFARRNRAGQLTAGNSLLHDGDERAD